MIRMNRTTEYGLIALRHISRKHELDPLEVTSAREIADCYGLPFDITAKTLQRLKETGLIQSAHGARGGYTLQRPLAKVSVGEFLELMEGPQSLVVCGFFQDPSQAPECGYDSKCEIKHFMSSLNERVLNLLSSIPLDELADGQGQEQERFSLAPAARAKEE